MFDRVLPVVLEFEGGYVNDPDDPGGATNKGVIQSTYDSYRKARSLPAVSVKYITDAEVYDIYKGIYIASGAEKIDLSFPWTAAAMFDTAVNMGDGIARRLLQKALNELREDRPILSVDGIIGQKTIRELYRHKDDEVLLEFLKQRKNRYEHLFINNPKLLKWKSSYWHRINTFAAMGSLTWRAK